MAKTIYKKKIKNNTEYYFFRLRHKNLRKPKDIYSKTVKELEKKIKEITRELDHGLETNKECFDTFMKDWLFNIKALNKKPSTIQRYECIYRNHIVNSDIAYIKLSDLSSMDIQDYYSKLSRQGKSASIIKNINVLIAPCIRYAFNNNFIMKDFSQSIVLPSDSNSKKLDRRNLVTPLTLEEQQIFLKAIKGHDMEALFITALNTGLRQGELLALTWKDIDLKDNYIEVNKNVKYACEVFEDGTRGKYKMMIQTPKTNAGIRKVVIPNFLATILKTHRKKQIEVKLKLANLYDDKDLVFPNSYGDYIFNSGLLKCFKRILKKSGIEDKKFHDLRHTYATRLFELGENPKTVQHLLGHSNISTTLDTYTHVLDSVKEKAVSKLDDLYKTMGQN